MKILLSNVVCRVTSSTKSEREDLDDILSFKVKGAEFSSAFRKGYWDGLRHLYDRRTRTFLSGLLPLVCQAYVDRDVQVSVCDGRVRPRATPQLFDGQEWFSLLSDNHFSNTSLSRCKLQVRGIRAVVKSSWRNLPWPRGIVQLPTGTGKTVLAAGLIQTLHELPSLFVVDRRDALWQTRDVLKQALDEKIGVIGDSRIELRHHTVGTIQTIRANLENAAFQKYLATIELLIIDECHKVGDNVYGKTLRKIPAYYRVGLSATALDRNDIDSSTLVGTTGDVLFDFSSAEAVRRGFLAAPVIRFVQVKKPVLDFGDRRAIPWAKRRNAAAKVYKEVYSHGIIDNPYRNKKIVRLAKRAVSEGLPTLVLVRSLRHGAALTKALRRGISGRVAYLHGSDATSRRRYTVSSFKKGRVDCLVASTIFDEAIDIPNIRCLILAGGGKSPIKAIQRVGRGMRRHEDKTELKVFDFLDRTHEYLLDHSLERLTTYEKKGFRLEVAHLQKLLNRAGQGRQDYS